MLGASEDNFIIDDLAGVGDGYGSTRAVGSHELSGCIYGQDSSIGDNEISLLNQEHKYL
jgi:hypothetical protein